LAAPYHDDVVTKAHEAIEHAFAEALAVAEQKHYGHKSPDDAEHGETRTQPVAEK